MAGVARGTGPTTPVAVVIPRKCRHQIARLRRFVRLCAGDPGRRLGHEGIGAIAGVCIRGTEAVAGEGGGGTTIMVMVMCVTCMEDKPVFYTSGCRNTEHLQYCSTEDPTAPGRSTGGKTEYSRISTVLSANNTEFFRMLGVWTPCITHVRTLPALHKNTPSSLAAHVLFNC